MSDSTNAEVPGLRDQRARHRARARTTSSRRPPADHRGLLRQPRAPGAAGSRCRGERTAARWPSSAGRWCATWASRGISATCDPVPGGLMVDAQARSMTCRHDRVVLDLAPGRRASRCRRCRGWPTATTRSGSRAGDTVILASSLIPGNENAVYRVINGLTRWGAHGRAQGQRDQVHVSGHAPAGELLYVLNVTRPCNFMPIHGEWRHLRAHARLAELTGVPRRPHRARRGRRGRRPRRRAGVDHRRGAVRLGLRRRPDGR